MKEIFYGSISTFFRRNLLIFFITASLIFIASKTYSQEDHHIIQYFNTHDGLASNTVNDILQDSTGVIWLATDNGLNCFNGYEFEKLIFQGLTIDSEFTKIREDSNQCIWTVGKSGRLYIKVKDDIIFKEYPWNDKVEKVLAGKKLEVLDFFVTEKEIRLIFDEIGILEIDHYSGTIKNLPHLRLDDLDRSITDKLTQKDGNFSNCIYTSTYDSIQVYRSKQLSCFVKDKQIYPIDKTKIVHSVNKNALGDLTFCTSDGLVIITQYGDDFFYRNLLEGLRINKIIADNIRGYWIASEFKGLLYLPSLKDKYVFRNSNSESIIDIINIDSTKSIVCTNKAVYTKNDRISIHMQELRRFSKDISSITFDKYEGTIWLNIRGELKFLDLKGNNLEKNKINLEKIGGNIEDILFTEDSAYKLSNNRLYKFYSSSRLDMTEIPLGLDSLLDVAREKKIFYNEFTKHILLFIDKALFIIDKNGSIIAHNELPVHTNEITCFVAEDFNHFYTGTRNSGILIFEDEKYISSIGINEGLNSNEIISLDYFRNLVFLSAKGLGKLVSPKDYADPNHTNMLNGIMERPAIKVVTHYARSFIWNKAGLLEVFHHFTVINSPSPKILEVSVDGAKRSDFGSFEYDENNIEISILTINPKLNGKISYQYRINGNSWVTTMETKISLTNLKSNEYELEIRSRNEDLIWSPSSILHFTILPAWWQTWIFRIGSLLIIIGISIILFRLRIKNLQKENDIAEELRSLEKSALQAQMNPHFVFNCLNAIQNFIQENDKEKAMDYLSCFAKLIRLNLNASVEKKISLIDEMLILENYLKLEKLRFEDSFDYKITINESIDQLIEIPPMLIQPIVENAIVHGVSNRESGGIIGINFQIINDQLKVTIKDNGIENTIPNDRHKSFGMSITQKRLELNNKNISAIKKRRIDDWTEVEMVIDI